MSQHKKCRSCKQLLTYEHFGELLSSPDLHNPICKPCRRYIRKQSYQNSKEGKPATLPDNIPLKNYNQDKLLRLLESQSILPIEINAKDVNSSTKYKIIIKEDNNSWFQTIYQGENFIRSIRFPITVRSEFFFDHLAEFLFKEDIKII